jgi:hypothetical protein
MLSDTISRGLGDSSCWNVVGGLSREQAKMSKIVSNDICQSQCKISKEESKILFEGRGKGSEDV